MFIHNAVTPYMKRNRHYSLENANRKVFSSMNNVAESELQTRIRKLVEQFPTYIRNTEEPFAFAFDTRVPLIENLLNEMQRNNAGDSPTSLENKLDLVLKESQQRIEAVPNDVVSVPRVEPAYSPLACTDLSAVSVPRTPPNLRTRVYSFSSMRGTGKNRSHGLFPFLQDSEPDSSYEDVSKWKDAEKKRLDDDRVVEYLECEVGGVLQESRGTSSNDCLHLIDRESSNMAEHSMLRISIDIESFLCSCDSHGIPVEHLDVSDNRTHLTGQAVTSIVSSWLVKSPAIFKGLITLGLGGIEMNLSEFTTLTKSISKASTPVLQELNLSRTGFGKWEGDACAILLRDALLELASTLKKLFIGGNYISSNVMKLIATALVSCNCLTSLDVSDSHDKAGIDMLCYWVGQISALESLDLSHSKLDSDSVFILSLSLRNHRRISHINLDNNVDIAQFGLDTLCRYLVFRGIDISLKNCFDGDVGQALSPAVNFADPSGHYTLQMDSPRDRTILLQLLLIYQQVEKGSTDSTNQWYRQALVDTFYDIKLNRKPYAFERDANGEWKLSPDSGCMTFTAIFRLLPSDKAKNAAEFKNLNKSVCSRDHPFVAHRPVVDEDLFTTFYSNTWKEVVTMEDRLRWMHAVSNTRILSTAQVSLLLESANSSEWFRKQVIFLILHKSVSDPWTFVRCYAHILKSLATDPAFFLNAAGAAPIAECFTSNNPTGPYSLNLGNALEHQLASHVIKLDRFDIEYLKQVCAKNVSRFSNIANCRIERKSFEFAAGWTLPHIGLWSFDYVSPHRFGLADSDSEKVPPTVDTKVWSKFCAELAIIFKTIINAHAVLGALRIISSSFYITSMQLAQLLKAMGNDPTHSVLKVDYVLVFSHRVVDYLSLMDILTKPVDSKGTIVMSDVQLQETLHRLGTLSCMNLMTSASLSFSCDLTSLQDQIVAQIIYTLFLREKKGKLMDSGIGPTLSSATASDPPKTWKFGLPVTGVWKGTFFNEVRGMNQALRKQLALKWCNLDRRTLAALFSKTKSTRTKK